MKAVKLAVLAESGNVLAAPPGMPAALRGMPAALSGVLALRDTHGKSMGAWGGELLYMKNFYGLELLKNHF